MPGVSSDMASSRTDKRRFCTNYKQMKDNRPTRIIVAGSRSITGRDAEVAVDAAMSQITAGGANRGMYEIVTGGAEGIDQAGKEWAKRYQCQYTEFKPEWDKHPGKSAGAVRNAEMAKYADKLVAIWDGESNGTRIMIEKALDEGLDIYVTTW